jgi:preprotein translocase subunit Sec63
MNLIHAVATADLLAELKRRKRIRVLTITTTFFDEFSEDTKYMHVMDSELVSRVGAALHNELYITFKDEVMARDAEDRPTQTAREASLMVLIPEGVDDDEVN